ncbi:hypothetical protein GCM10027060_05540 [Nesterenkonia halophila]
MTETIVITGASDGIGAAAARQLADDGHRLVLVGRSPEKTRAVAEEVGAEHHLADFTRIDDVQIWKRFTANRAYGNAKLANILLVRELHARFHAEGLSAVPFHPGFVATNFASGTSSWFRLAYRSALRRMFTTPEKVGKRLAG